MFINSSPGLFPPFSMLEICFSASQNMGQSKNNIEWEERGKQMLKRGCRSITNLVADGVPRSVDKDCRYWSCIPEHWLG